MGPLTRPGLVVVDQQTAHRGTAVLAVDHRRLREPEPLEQARRVANVHARVHADDRLGHDLVDIDSIRGQVFCQHLAGDVRQGDHTVFVVSVALAHDDGLGLHVHHRVQRVRHRRHAVQHVPGRLADLHTFSSVSERLALVAEEMPNQIMKDVSKLQKQTVNQVMTDINKWSDVTLDKVMAKVAIEREAFISQFMNRLIGEQKIALEALLTEEQRVTGLVTELRKTIEGSNNLLLSVNTLAETFNVGEPSPEPKNAKPFDIKEYKDTIAEVTTLVETTNQLVGTVGLEKLLPELVKAIDQVGNEGEEIIDHSFRQGVLFILIAMGAYIIARLIYNFLNKKLITSRA